jgi:hypothetical protein
LKTHRLARSRIAVIGLGVLAAASFALAGCKTANTTEPNANPSSTAASPSMSPQAALINAIAQLKSTGYDISVTSSQGISGAGSVDPGKKSTQLNATGSVQGQQLQLGAVQIGAEVYIKLDLGALNQRFGIPTQWMKIDTTKFNKPLFDYGSGTPFDVAKLAGAVTNVTQTDPQHISGTIDLSKVAGAAPQPGMSGSPIAPAPSGSASAGAATTVTFQATLDNQGRLTDLKINDGPNQSMSQDIKITNYGSPSAVTAPSDSVPAPDSIYQFLNG